MSAAVHIFYRRESMLRLLINQCALKLQNFGTDSASRPIISMAWQSDGTPVSERFFIILQAVKPDIDVVSLRLLDRAFDTGDEAQGEEREECAGAQRTVHSHMNHSRLCHDPLGQP